MPVIDQSGMRRLNTHAVLRVLADTSGVVTNAELVAQTRLSRRTIELILADLIARGWVREADPPEAAAAAGRPKKYFAFVADRALVLSVMIVPPQVGAVVADAQGTELARASSRLVNDDDAAAAVHMALAVAGEALAASARDRDRLAGIVVGVSGTVGVDGVVHTSPVGPEWPGKDLRTPFQDAFSAPTSVENDANLVAVAEHAFGAVRDESTFVVLTPGNRVSAGVVIDGDLYRGFQGAAGELVRLPVSGPDLHEHPVARISSPHEAEREAARAILRRAAAGDEAAAALAREFFASVARLVATIGWVLAPPVLVVSGGLEGVEGIVRTYLGEALAALDLPEMDVRVAPLPRDAVLRGGVRFALDSLGADIFGID
ncbi:ROK family protein [Microbacterium sp. NPDC089189]|uniref:ROK family transcriptional regulator n=1 Tax=Microbacterium sp. NPDC089189 TaxID=3154972 RepID=UPI00344875C6